MFFLEMPAVRGDGMRGLAVFISDIRNCKYDYSPSCCHKWNNKNLGAIWENLELRQN